MDEGGHFNVLLLDENEVYINDRPDGVVRFALLPLEKREGGRHEVPVGERLASSLLHPGTSKDAHVRLSSRSLIIEPMTHGSDGGDVKVVKVPFAKVRYTTVGRGSLTLVTDEVIRIALSRIAGESRVIKPYMFDKPAQALWRIDIAFHQQGGALSKSPVTGTSASVTSTAQPISATDLRVALSRYLQDPAGIQCPSAAGFLELTYLLTNLYASEQSTAPSARVYPQVIQGITSCVPSPSSFPLSSLVSHREKVLVPSLRAWLQQPLYRHAGILCLTSEALRFRPYPLLHHVKQAGGPARQTSRRRHHDREIVLHISWPDLKHAFLTLADLQPRGLCLLHVVLDDSGVPAAYGETLIVFENEADRATVVDTIQRLRPSAFVSEKRDSLTHYTELWRTHRLDNFHYLGLLNTLSGRSSSDFSYYPVMPWTYINFEHLDLSDPKNYRDLSRPLGALCPELLQRLRSRMNDLEACDVPLPFGTSRRFLYGSHYSTAAYVVYWLLREFPEGQLRVQGGKFDVWPRLFHSVQATWKGLEEGRATSFMELIPQFYSADASAFLENRLGITVSVTTPGIEESHAGTGVLADVKLPDWAAGNSVTFLKCMREALESDVVSSTLHHWIDLIFGYQQSGDDAERVHNNFHPVTYVTSLVSRQQFDDKAKDFLAEFGEDLQHPTRSLMTQVREFGQAPVQLFDQPHPRRLTSQELAESEGSNHVAFDTNDITSLLRSERCNYPWFVYLEQHPTLFPSSSAHATTQTPSKETQAPPPVLSASTSDTSVRLKAPERALSHTNVMFPEGCVVGLGTGCIEDEEPARLRFKSSRIHGSPLSCRTPTAELCPFTRVAVFGCDDGYLHKVQLEDQAQHTDPTRIPATSAKISSLAVVHHDIYALGTSHGAVVMVNATSVFPVSAHAENSPHLDNITGLSYDGHETLCSGGWAQPLVVTTRRRPVSDDDVVALWKVSQDAPTLLRTHDHLDCSSLDAGSNLLLVGTRQGQISLWDLRCESSRPIWLGAISSKNDLRWAVVDTNVSRIASHGFFGIAVCENHPMRCQPAASRLGLVDARRSPQSFTAMRAGAFLLDARRLTSSFPFPAPIDCATVGKMFWPEISTMLAVRTDGARFAVATGLLPLTVTSESPDVPTQTDAAFVSVVDLTGGPKSFEVCRWPLQLGTMENNALQWNQLPVHIPSGNTWNIAAAQRHTEFPYIALGNSVGQIECIH